MQLPEYKRPGRVSRVLRSIVDMAGSGWLRRVRVAVFLRTRDTREGGLVCVMIFVALLDSSKEQTHYKQFSFWSLISRFYNEEYSILTIWQFSSQSQPNRSQQ